MSTVGIKVWAGELVLGKRRKVERAGKDGVSELEWEGWSLSD